MYFAHSHTSMLSQLLLTLKLPLTYPPFDDGFANWNLVFSENKIEGKGYDWEVNIPAGTLPLPHSQKHPVLISY